MLLMAKESRRKAGRPVAENPKRTLVSFRLDGKIVKALEEERQAMGVLTFSLSDAARELIVRVLKERGRL